MDWGKAFDLIKVAAPMVGSLFGPAGTAVGATVDAGINLISSVLGVEPSKEAIAQAVVTDPNAIEKIKELEINAKVELQKLAVQKLGMELADTQNARDRDEKITEITGKRDKEDKAFDWIIIVAFFLCLMGLLYFKPVESTYIGMMIGAIVAAFMSVVNFRKGTTASSQAKTAMLYNSTPIKE
ncbi:MAG: hypothetical protein ABSC54_00775 [Smithellaceae bacterium]|jgi:hypothetical protein